MAKYPQPSTVVRDFPEFAYYCLFSVTKDTCSPINNRLYLSYIVYGYPESFVPQLSPRILNESFLRNLKPPAESRLEVSDTRRPGLRLRISAAGKAVWMYEKRVKGGAKRKHTLGTYCTWSKSGQRHDGAFGLAEARALALEIEAEASRGIDRVAIAKEEKLRAETAKSVALTVQDVLATYDALHLSNLKRGDERARQLQQSLHANLTHPIGELTKYDLQRPIDEKLAEGRAVYANRIRAALMAFSRWAFERGHLETDIGAGLPKATKEVARERAPSIDEVRAIWAASFDMGDLWGPFIRLMVLTAQRRSEILGLEWSEIDLESQRITKPGTKTKNGKEHITHL
ncbi:MAG: integrase family protein, partial [Pseudomonadota bacterium]